MNEFLRFIVDKMRRDLLRLSFIHFDETVLKALEETKHGSRIETQIVTSRSACLEKQKIGKWPPAPTDLYVASMGLKKYS